MLLYKRIGDQVAEGKISLSIGNAYMQIGSLRNLAQAERWYQHSLELRDERDQLWRGKCYLCLGQVAYEHLIEAQEAKKPEGELLSIFRNSLAYHRQGLDLLPPEATGDLAAAHLQLGHLYRTINDFGNALVHFQTAIRYSEAVSHLHKTAEARYYMVDLLGRTGRLADAREYALVAMRDYEALGEEAVNQVHSAKQMLIVIEDGLARFFP